MKLNGLSREVIYSIIRGMIKAKISDHVSLRRLLVVRVVLIAFSKSAIT